MSRPSSTLLSWTRAAACAGLLALTPSLAHAELVDRIAAVVNKDIIPLSEVEQRAAPELARLSGSPKERAAKKQELLKRAVDVLIAERLLEAEQRELNVDVTDQDLDVSIADVKREQNLSDQQFEERLRTEGYTLSSYREYLRKFLAKRKLINLKVRSKVQVSDEDLKAEYKRFAKLESEDVEIHARHILVLVNEKASPAQVEESRKKAEALAQEARRPGVDFAELAKKKSEGPSAAEGGDLGFFRRGVMVPEFERAAFSLPDGGVSDPIRTKLGWYVIKVEERRSPAPPEFEEVKEKLRERLLGSQLEKYTEQYVQELRQRAIVEVKI